MNRSNIKKRNVILIVDDETSNLAIFSTILEDDYKVLAVRSGIEAINIIKRGIIPDIILLDIIMPEMDGYETIKELKKVSFPRYIPVIFITTLENEVDEEHGFELGAVDYINKPVNSSIVKARIKTHLELIESKKILKEQNRWLEKEVHRQVKNNLLLQELSLTSLVGLAETRDSDTGNHILRTKFYVEAIANRLHENQKFRDQLPFSKIELISKAAQLHDIGKIGIPDNILLKQGSLDFNEFEIMKTHTTIGGTVLNNALSEARNRIKPNTEDNIKDVFSFLETARIIAISHHEKWDGTGYPQGLKQNQIPLEGRIMIIADIFDALISKRVYKEPYDFKSSLNIMEDMKGVFFDPEILEAFLSIKSEIKDIYNKLKDITTDDV